MPKTAVGLFRNSGPVDAVVREIESLGFPRNEIRTVGEPLDLAVTGVMSIPLIDFEVELVRELTRIGATRPQINAYIDGLRHRGILVLATGGDEKVDQAARIMNDHGASETDETTGREPHFPRTTDEGAASPPRGQVQVGRVREQSGGARFFVW
jgi:hypothetical protein